MCNTCRMPRITRKRKVTQKKSKTVPSIRKAFDSFHSFLRTPRSEADVKKKFKELFGKGKLTKDQVANLLKMPPQKGGMAPLDYSTGPPDARLPTVPYVQRGFGFANQSSLTAYNPKEYLGSTPQMGGKRRGTQKRRQRGGGIADFAASVGAQPFLMSAPPTIFQAAAHTATGQIGLPSSQPSINPLSIHPPTYIQGANILK
jgi:hypothetical protein